jgi:hypothetical protein
MDIDLAQYSFSISTISTAETSMPKFSPPLCFYQLFFFFFFLLFEEVKNRFKVSNKERFVRLRKNEPVRRNTKTKIEKQNF